MVGLLRGKHAVLAFKAADHPFFGNAALEVFHRRGLGIIGPEAVPANLLDLFIRQVQFAHRKAVCFLVYCGVPVGRVREIPARLYREAVDRAVHAARKITADPLIGIFRPRARGVPDGPSGVDR